MSGRPLANQVISQPPLGAVEFLPVAALIWSADRICVAANAMARALFAPLPPEGLGPSVLFARWPSPPDLRSADTLAETAMLAHGDGRLFALRATTMPDATLAMTLTDVSAEVKSGETQARDALTGLLQRAGFRDRLAEAIAVAERNGTRLAILYMDLDRFKGVNDTLGHDVGDALLVKVADRLRNVLRRGDAVARFGGDEFAILQGSGDVSGETAQVLATRLIALVTRAYAVQGHMLNIGASLGIAMYPDDGADADTLLRHADLAHHRAKADGRGMARFFEPAMNARMQARRTLEAGLRRALTMRQFTLAYQPQMQLASAKVVGFEALLRWTHPERGSVSPADFIPLSEEIGLIVPIGEWVLRTACQQAAAWPIPATVAVNISPVQFKSGKLAELVASALARSGLPAERLELEITEGTLLDETNLVLTTLHAIRALGVSIAMDDFGTGYSSLSYLRKFPFDKIKIDQSFVRGVGTERDCDAIVRAVVTLGASLGMRTTAEGVETQEQLDRIRGKGCDEVQGYFTGRPMTGTEALALLHTQAQRS